MDFWTYMSIPYGICVCLFKSLDTWTSDHTINKVYLFSIDMYLCLFKPLDTWTSRHTQEQCDFIQYTQRYICMSD